MSDLVTVILTLGWTALFVISMYKAFNNHPVKCSNGFEGCTHDNLTDEDIYQMLTKNHYFDGQWSYISNGDNRMRRDCYSWFWKNRPPDIERHEAYVSAMLDLDEVEKATVGHTIIPLDVEKEVSDIITDAQVRKQVSSTLAGSRLTDHELWQAKREHLETIAREHFKNCRCPKCSKLIASHNPPLVYEFKNCRCDECYECKLVTEYDKLIQTPGEPIVIQEFGNPEPILLSKARVEEVPMREVAKLMSEMLDSGQISRESIKRTRPPMALKKGTR